MVYYRYLKKIIFSMSFILYITIQSMQQSWKLTKIPSELIVHITTFLQEDTTIHPIKTDDSTKELFALHQKYLNTGITSLKLSCKAMNHIIPSQFDPDAKMTFDPKLFFDYCINNNLLIPCSLKENTYSLITINYSQAVFTTKSNNNFYLIANEIKVHPLYNPICNLIKYYTGYKTPKDNDTEKIKLEYLLYIKKSTLIIESHLTINTKYGYSNNQNNFQSDDYSYQIKHLLNTIKQHRHILFDTQFIEKIFTPEKEIEVQNYLLKETYNNNQTQYVLFQKVVSEITENIPVDMFTFLCKKQVMRYLQNK